MHRFTAEDIVGGHLALDFANTITARDTTPRDWLTDYDTACDWAALTGAFAATDIRQLRRRAAAAGAQAAASLQRLLDLRECIHDLVVARMSGAPVSAALARRLERHWKVACSAAFSVTETPSPRWTGSASGLELIRHVVAWEAAAFLNSDALARTRVCAGDNCGWLFVDTSKSGRRRWCDMKTCGNVAKARRHYRRSQSA